MWDEKEIRKQKLGGLLGVNRGSEQAPRFLRLEYAPDKPRGTVALVGKGITFDSGGLSLKPSDGMVGMKGDMGGAAAVLGTFRAIAALGAKVRVLGFLPITDNMTGGDATRVGDVLTIRNGKTVEVLNTDAEGRLILADGLSLATEEAPDAIVDLATLTGACMVALGDRMAGLMGNHEGWIDQVRAAADAAGEPVWPLPLPALPPRQARQRAGRPQEHHRHALRRRAGGGRVPPRVRRRGHPVGAPRHRRPGRLRRWSRASW